MRWDGNGNGNGDEGVGLKTEQWGNMNGEGSRARENDLRVVHVLLMMINGFIESFPMNQDENDSFENQDENEGIIQGSCSSLPFSSHTFVHLLLKTSGLIISISS